MILYNILLKRSVMINNRTLKKLLDDYNSLSNPKHNTAVKYKGVFKNNQIHIYFDAWDLNNYNFQPSDCVLIWIKF